MSVVVILLIVSLVFTGLHITYSLTAAPIKNKITGAKAKAAAAQAKVEAQQKQIEQLTIAINRMNGKTLADAINA